MFFYVGSVEVEVCFSYTLSTGDKDFRKNVSECGSVTILLLDGHCSNTNTAILALISHSSDLMTRLPTCLNVISGANGIQFSQFN